MTFAIKINYTLTLSIELYKILNQSKIRTLSILYLKYKFFMFNTQVFILDITT